MTARTRTSVRSKYSAFVAASLASSCLAAFPMCAQADFRLDFGGRLNSARAGAFAAVLPSGRVLMVGGDGGGYLETKPLASAELYVPNTGQFLRTGSMVSARREFMGSLLNNGKVLVAGGKDGGRGVSASLSTAEIYDPTTGAFIPTGAMSHPRSDATATLLQSGKVLIAGGESAGETAEIYDPSAGTFRLAAGRMNVPRWGASATLLMNGKVLIAGGMEAGTNRSSASAEIYDPVTDSFIPTGAMSVPRAGATATLLQSGKVLIAGGVPERGTAEIYDPVTGSFSATGAMSVPRIDGTSTLLPSGRVLVAGGFEWPSPVEVYTPASETFSPVESASVVGRFLTASRLNDGRVLLAGGSAVNAIDYAELISSVTSAEPSLSGVPNGATRSTSASIIISGRSGGTNFTCSLDARPFVACVSPFQVTGLAEGKHSITVKQIDEGGDGRSFNTVWTVDLTAPAMPTITAKPSPLNNSGSATFNFKGEVGADYSCSLDKKPWAACTSSPTFTGLSDGPHSLQVKQIDEAGNTSTYAASASWTVDTKAPLTPLITGHPLAVGNSRSASFAFGKPETGATSTCSIDSAAFVACATGKLYSGLADGQHSFALVVSDKAGNVSIARTFGWLVDTVRPTLAYNPVDSKAKTKTQTIYNLTPNPDASGIGRAEYSLSVKTPSLTAVNVPANTAAYASPVIFKTVAAIRWLRIQDKAGNWSSWYPA